MIRSYLRDEVRQALALGTGTMREVAREEVVRAIQSVAPAESSDGAMRFIAQQEAATISAAEAGRAVSAALATLGPTRAREMRVRALVREEVARLVAEHRPRVIDVRLNAGTPVRVDGDSHEALADLLLALSAACHVFLVGPAGTGKSTMAQQAATAMGIEFFALSVGPTTPTSKLFGYLDASGNYHDTPFRRAYEDGGLMLLDEVDNGHPGLLTELNQALALDICAFADGMVRCHPGFRLVATGNTHGTGGDRQYVGRQTLDAATLDRFVMIDVPVDEGLETRLALDRAPSHPLQAQRIIWEVRRLRKLAEDKKLPVMFSPRATINAAKLLEAGASVALATRWCVTKGLSSAHRSALELVP
jgi:MoxR-like ATPase